EIADHVDGPVRAVLGVLDVVAENALGLARRAVERARAGTPQDLGQHVPLEPAGYAEAEADVDDHPDDLKEQLDRAGADDDRGAPVEELVDRVLDVAFGRGIEAR